jgi:hypothetical protein
VLHTPGKVPAPWQGRINEHYRNEIEIILTTIVSTPLPRAALDFIGPSQASQTSDHEVVPSDQ